MTSRRVPPFAWILAGMGVLACSCPLLSFPALAPANTSLPPATATSAATGLLATETPVTAATAWPVKPTLTLPPTEGDDDSLALLPEFAADAAREDATRYSIEASVEFDPASNRAGILGQARIRYTVPPDAAIDEVPLMLWPNDRQYAASMVVGPALINGHRIEGELDLGGIVRRYRLPRSADPGDVLDISVPFAIEARGPISGFSPRRFGITEGVLIAPTFYPLIPRRIDGDWQVIPAPDGGDTTNSDTALYRVSLTVPKDQVLAASGVETARTDNGGGMETVEFISGPMRDFAFALGPFDLRERTVDGATVRAWSLPEHSVEADEMLEAAADQLALLNEWVGPYPYTELDVVDAPGAFGGIEYPGLVFVGTLGTSWLIEPTVHEVAHQWFYGLIGDDQLIEPWLDEALATYASVLYLEEYGPPGAAAGAISQFRQTVRASEDPTLPIGLPVGDYPSPGEYGAIVYRKGALFLDALRGEIGDEDFHRFLMAYFADQRYEFASGADFQQAAEQACECDLDPLFDLWVWEGGEIPGL